MDILEAIILAIVQGITEFLPISSSAHLVLVPWWLGWDKPPLMFDVAVHLGTTVAVLWYFWQDWLQLIQAGLNIVKKRHIETTTEWLLIFLMIATIPAVLAGVLLESSFESLTEPAYVAVALFITAALLTISQRIADAANINRPLDSLNWRDAIAVGLAQALAIVPGISRSGSTIATGQLRNLSREAAARFSFLMSAPIILGAGVKQGLDVLTGSETVTGEMAVNMGIGFLVSAIVGYASIAFLLNYVRRRPLLVFAVYCVLFGSVSLIAIAIRG